MYSGCGLHSAAVNLKLEPVCNKSYQFGADTTFDHLCNINAGDVKYDGDCISGLAFMRVTLFDPASVVYRDVTRQAKELYRLKYLGALRSGLAYLSRCNSGWFCHTNQLSCSRD
jgi:hypothetical protein